jgi:hypothetical protein
MLICFVLGLICHKSDNSLKIIILLLFISILTEVIVYMMYYVLNMKKEYLMIYHIYIPIEYLLLSSYFYFNIKNEFVKELIQYSIILFYCICVLSSILFFNEERFCDFPGYILCLSGGFLMIWCIFSLYEIRPTDQAELFQSPLFWICVGIFIYYSVSVPFNVTYDFFYKNDQTLAKFLNKLINKGANYILYICFSTAFLCSNRLRKYT